MFEPDGETAILEAVLAAHPGAEPLLCEVPVPGRHALATCLAVRVEHPVPHWLLVSRGLTELGEKVEEDPDVSGWGFELTCRLPARSEDVDFGWAMNWMQNVADHLADQITFTEPYHHVRMWTATSEDEIAAIVLVEDVELEATRSRNGSFTFLQMVGLTTGEYESLQAWNGRGLVELIRARDPLFLMDVERATYLRDPAFARAVLQGSEREGSSTAILDGRGVLWFVRDDAIEVHLDVDAARDVRTAMTSRLAHGNALVVYGAPRKTRRPDGSLVLHSQVNIVLQPEDAPSEVSEIEGRKAAIIRLNDDAVDELAVSLRDEPGTYALATLPGVRFVVATSERFRDPAYGRDPSP